MCQFDDFFVKANDYGIITSSNYPNWTPNEMCTKLITAPVGYVIRVYINDYSIADVNRTTEKCDNEYLVLNSGESVRTYCGVRTKNGNNVFESSSNELLIQYKTSSLNNGQYRGFNFYFESKNKLF